MITCTQSPHSNILEIALSGAVSGEDYETVLIPAIDRAIEEHDTIRALVTVARGTEYTLQAMGKDAWMGMKHWRGFDRVAMVGEEGWITRATRGFAVFMPCPVKVFEPDEADAARRWLRESLGAIHQTDLGGGVLHIKLLGKLDPEAYDAETADLNAFIRANGGSFRLLLDLREFDGWQGIAGLFEHFKLVRDHRSMVEKAAIVGDADWEKLISRVATTVIGAEARFFDEDFEKALAWIKA